MSFATKSDILSLIKIHSVVLHSVLHLIDCCIINVQWQTFHAYQDENNFKFNAICGVCKVCQTKFGLKLRLPLNNKDMMALEKLFTWQGYLQTSVADPEIFISGGPLTDLRGGPLQSRFSDSLYKQPKKISKKGGPWPPTPKSASGLPKWGVIARVRSLTRLKYGNWIKCPYSNRTRLRIHTSSTVTLFIHWIFTNAWHYSVFFTNPVVCHMFNNMYVYQFIWIWLQYRYLYDMIYNYSVVYITFKTVVSSLVYFFLNHLNRRVITIAFIKTFTSGLSV